ncbi:MAG TPA: hypothetical protein VOA87_21985 [Thermoanaerobaculia bacterium]|nr:hypothetical protein [Thermoanaerobaculia bacterium]
MAQPQTPRPPKQTGIKTLNNQVNTWVKLATHVRANLTDMPQAGDDLAAFEQAVAHVQDMGNQEQAFTAQLRAAKGSRIQGVLDGIKLRNRLAAHVAAKYGPENEKLLEFGLRPRNRRFRRKPPAAAQPPAVQPASPTTPVAPAGAAANSQQ